MTFDICIIDNEQKDIIRLISYMRKWEELNNLALNIDIYHSGLTVINKIKNNNLIYNLIILDIVLNDINGLKAAQDIRKYNFKGDIVFLTACKKYVFEAYNVQALNFFLKPVKYENIQQCFDYLKHKICSLTYSYHYYKDIIRIPFSAILYIISRNQYIELNTVDAIYRQAKSLKKIMSELPEEFFQCHRSIIINLNYVDKIAGNELFLTNGTSLPVSTSYTKVTKERLKK